jgi:hypothetical protein
MVNYESFIVSQYNFTLYFLEMVFICIVEIVPEQGLRMSLLLQLVEVCLHEFIDLLPRVYLKF